MIVRSVGLASPCALTSIIRSREILLANVVAWRVDGTAELDWAAEARLRARRVVLSEAIGSGNHNVEIPSVLTLVGGRLLGDRRAPERALDVGERVWLRASFGRSERRITFKIEVEPGAKVGGVAELLAFDGVVRLECIETQVGIGTDRGLEVLERGGVSLRWIGTSRIGSVLKQPVSYDIERECASWMLTYSEGLVSQEGFCAVGRGLWAIAVGLWRAWIVDAALGEVTLAGRA